MLDSVLFIVEGRSDKDKLLEFLPSDANIVCTNGTMDEEDFLVLLEPYEGLEFVTLFDADRSGEKLRKTMKRIYPESLQLIIPTEYREVAETPAEILLELMQCVKWLSEQLGDSDERVDD